LRDLYEKIKKRKGDFVTEKNIKSIREKNIEDLAKTL